MTFLILREKCISENISVGSNKGNVNIDLNIIKNKISSFDDIKETLEIEGIKCVLSYPSKFNLGSTDFIFSLIESIEIEDETIVISSLTNSEYDEVMSKLPETIFNHLHDFVNKNKHHFEMLVFNERQDLEVDEIRLNLLDTSLPAFVASLFDCIDGTNYREMLFVLCKRIPDVTFLTNCTYLEIEDFYKLYSDETEKQNESLQNQSSS